MATEFLFDDDSRGFSKTQKCPFSVCRKLAHRMVPAGPRVRQV